MIQPETGPITLKELRECTNPESYTIGRLSCAIVYQGCNSWTILRIVADYYQTMCERDPKGTLWPERLAELLAIEKKWAESMEVKPE